MAVILLPFIEWMNLVKLTDSVFYVSSTGLKTQKYSTVIALKKRYAFLMKRIAQLC